MSNGVETIYCKISAVQKELNNWIINNPSKNILSVTGAIDSQQYTPSVITYILYQDSSITSILNS